MPFPASKLTIHPAEILRRKTEKIVDFDEDLRHMVEEMITIMHESDGVGLAAPQAGHSVQVFVCNAREDGEEDMVFVNPEIKWASPERVECEEGCLSVPGIYEPVTRPERVRVRAQDLDGKVFELDCDGLLAVCIQHEMDHLDGKLFVDYLSALKRQRLKKKLLKARKRDAADEQSTSHSPTL